MSVPSARQNNVPRQMPWETALYDAVSKVEDRLAEARRLYAEQKAELMAERAKVREARRRLENWKLREAGWHAERAELLRRLGEK